MALMRTDRNNNPAAFTTQIAAMALQEGIDYSIGEPFAVSGVQYFTAKLLGDPIALTIKLIDKITFYTKGGAQRWTYIGMPQWLWLACSPDDKKRIIGFMYQHEGGTALRALFET